MTDNEYWKGELQRGWKARFPRRRQGIKVSTKISLCGRSRPRLHLSAAGVCANMQDDGAAFEGWLLALRAWCGIPGASLIWDRPPRRNGNYQRFLFRVAHFQRLFPWLEVEDGGELARAATAGDARLVLNQGGDERGVASDGESEAALERALLGWPGLPAALGMDEVDHQFPVGLFRGEVAGAAGVFPARKAAVDLVGWQAHERRFLLVELKKLGNEKIGAVSELFFYAMLLQDVRRDRFGVGSVRGARVRVGARELLRAVAIDAIWLAPGYHTLLANGRITALLNEACAAAGELVRFGRCRLIEEPGEQPFALEDLEPCPRRR